MDPRPKRQCKKPLRYKTTSSSDNNSSRLQIKRRRMSASTETVHDDIQAIRAAYEQFSSETAPDGTGIHTIDPIRSIPSLTNIPLESSTSNNHLIHSDLNSQPMSQHNTRPTYTTLMPLSPTTSSTYVPIPLWNPSSPYTTTIKKASGLPANSIAHSIRHTTTVNRNIVPQVVCSTTSAYNQSSYDYIPPGFSGVTTPSFTAFPIPTPVSSTGISQEVPFHESLAKLLVSSNKILQDIPRSVSSSLDGIPQATAPSDYRVSSVLQPLSAYTSHSYSAATDTRVPSTVSSSYVPPRIHSQHTFVASASTSSVTNSSSFSYAPPPMNPAQLATSAASLNALAQRDIAAALPVARNDDAALPGPRNNAAVLSELENDAAVLPELGNDAAVLPAFAAEVDVPQVRIEGNVGNALVKINEKLGAIERTLRTQRRRGVQPKPEYLPFRRIDDILDFNETDQDTYEQLRFFGQAGGANDHPATPTFLQLYKMLSIYGMVKPPELGNCSVRTGNCTGKTMFSFTDLENIYSQQDNSAITNIKAKLDGLVEETSPENWDLELQDEHSYAKSTVTDCVIYYCTGYLCRQLNKTIICPTCQAAFSSNQESSSASVARLVELKTRGKLIHPNVNFFNFIKRVEETFQRHVNSAFVFEDTLSDLVKNSAFEFPCNDHKDDVIAFSLRYYLIMRMRQFSHSLNVGHRKGTSRIEGQSEELYI